jgi:20S proteasome subunit beta 7
MQRTTYPIVTGTSVIGVKYDGGVMMVADTLGA